MNEKTGLKLSRRQVMLASTLMAGAAASTFIPSSGLAQPSGSPSPYTTAERDRRWSALRAMMDEQGVDCLVVPAMPGDFTLHYASYITNAPFNYGTGFVILPREGQAVAMNLSPGPGAWARVVGSRGEPMGPAIANLINEFGNQNDRIGVVGTETGVFGLNNFTSQGLMLYAIWSEIEASLPGADFVDVTPAYAMVNMVKGEEEIAAFEKAADLGEAFHRMLLEYTRPGITDSEFRSTVEEFLISNGATADVKALEIQPGPIRQGHIINSEYGIEAFGGYAQVSLCMCVGEPNQEIRDLHKIAQDSFAAGLEVIKPGIRFREVYEPMEKVVRDAGCWHGFPLVHGIRPVVLAGPVGIGRPIGTYDDPLGSDIELKPGMALSFEPGARMGRMNQVKVGSSAFVTENGVRLLNSVGKTLQQI